MRIVACTDIHEDLSALSSVRKMSERADLVVCCGDFTVFERRLDAMLLRFEKFSCPVFLIHGNHESSENVRSLCAGLKNVVFFHKKVVTLDGVSFVGWGGGGFSRRDSSFEQWWRSNARKLESPVVFATHAPPFGTTLDRVGGRHVGCESFTEFIVKTQPVLALSGHIEENKRRSDFLGSTKLVNPGPKGKLFTVDSWEICRKN